MNVVMIIPTGVGCEIGGHAGDATPVAKLLGKCCDKLILHPNVVNASNINEMPENSLYVEGSILDQFLIGVIELEEVRNNKILVAVNCVEPEIVNTVSAARTTLGVDIEIVELDIRLEMEGVIQADGSAWGYYSGVSNLIRQFKDKSFDALAVVTDIKVSAGTKAVYLDGGGGVNPWGKVESMVSREIASALRKPVAHAPAVDNEPVRNILDPRKAAEFISSTFCYCIFKGLQKAPRIGKGLSVSDVEAVILPFNVWNDIYSSCRKRYPSVKFIIVKENKTCFRDFPYPDPHGLIFVENYWEAAGVLSCFKAGIQPESVRRPLSETIYT
ncbi:MAG: DUF3326 domain-containing protein [Desulfobacteraceae bacterium]|jgi:hypothetical protein